MQTTQLISYLIQSLQHALVSCDVTKREGIQRDKKADGSWVTNMDWAVHNTISQHLQQVTPGIPLVSEEDGHSHHIQTPLYWMLDPIDGTSSMISGSMEYVCLLALMHNQQPVLGGVAVPHEQSIYWGDVLRSQTGKVSPGGVAVSWGAHTVHTQELVQVTSATRPVAQPCVGVTRMEHVNSGIKFVRIAEASAHVYERHSWLNDWDVAAGEALILASGGMITSLQGHALVYGTPRRMVPPFLACAAGVKVSHIH